jgi:hypothetical protein
MTLNEIKKACMAGLLKIYMFLELEQILLQFF